MWSKNKVWESSHISFFYGGDPFRKVVRRPEITHGGADQRVTAVAWETSGSFPSAGATSRSLNKSWRQHPTRLQLYGHLPPITKTIQVRRTMQDTAGEGKSGEKGSGISVLPARYDDEDEIISRSIPRGMSFRGKLFLIIGPLKKNIWKNKNLVYVILFDFTSVRHKYWNHNITWKALKAHKIMLLYNK